MSTKTKDILAFALSGAICVMGPCSGAAHPQQRTASASFDFSILANAQEPTPKQDTREEEHEKKPKKDSQDNEKAAHEKSGTEAKPHESSRQEGQNRPERTAPSNERPASQEHAQRPAPQEHPQHPAANAHYQFRQQDRPKLRPHFQSQLAHVDRAHRPHVAAGGYMESNYQTYLVPVPQDVIVYLAPPPPGYVFGYYYGYIIVYDPATLLVLDVIDLL
jgi:hypothetical protein